jgi:general stress protein 26
LELEKNSELCTLEASPAPLHEPLLRCATARPAPVESTRVSAGCYSLLEGDDAMDSAMHEKIVAILSRANDMTLATVRPDGYPQATTVGYVNDGVTLYFGTGADTQKARNIALCDKVSLTVNLPYDRWEEIQALSMGARAARLTDPKEIAKVGRLMLKKFPQGADFGPEETDSIALFSIKPVVVSVLDYRKGFGHTELVKV